MSLLPELPPDVEIVSNETGYWDMAGGTSGRALILRSDTSGPADIAAFLMQAFDHHPDWKRDERSSAADAAVSWSHLPSCLEEETSVAVCVAEPGAEVYVAEGTTPLTIDEPAAVVHLSTWYLSVEQRFGRC